MIFLYSLISMLFILFFFFFQAEDGIRYLIVTGVQTCALPICLRVGGQFGHPGATLRQTSQPDHIVIHAVELCKNCGSSFDQGQPPAIIRRQVFDISHGRVKVTEHRAEARLCLECGITTEAVFPASVRAPVQYGEGALSRSVYLPLYQPLPVNRTAETMRDLFGCALSAATVQLQPASPRAS